MASGKLYTGIVLEDDYLKIARISIVRKQAVLVKLDKVKLVSGVAKAATTDAVAAAESANISFDDVFDKPAPEEDTVFGISADAGVGSSGSDTVAEDFNLDVDLKEEQNAPDADFGELDMADDTGEIMTGNNDMLFYNLLSGYNAKKIHFATNIPAGGCIFQILRDADFNKIKSKDLQAIVSDRLESVYNKAIGKDYYSYAKRSDGSLFLASTDEEPQTLQLVEGARSLYTGKLFVDDILPDETILIGLMRANYNPEPDSISAVIQYGESYCRILFMKGTDLAIVSPIITEGSKSRKFLNTVFSKILFQLDTGEIPNLDRIILCNNILGDESIGFLHERFPDISISEFNFDGDLFNPGNIEPSTVASFTTAIGAAWASAGFKRDMFPRITFLPASVRDRQKVFKLQWHGFMLLFLIFLTPVAFNYYNIVNTDKIEELESSVMQLRAQVMTLESVVAEYNKTNQDLSAIQGRLVLLNELSTGALKWSVNLDILNRGFENVGSVWLTSLSGGSQSSGFDLDGYSIYKNRVPMLADMFNNAVLQDVNRSEIREKEVFVYHYNVKKVVADDNMYTSDNAKELKEVLGGN